MKKKYKEANSIFKKIAKANNKSVIFNLLKVWRFFI